MKVHIALGIGGRAQEFRQLVGGRIPCAQGEGPSDQLAFHAEGEIKVWEREESVRFLRCDVTKTGAGHAAWLEVGRRSGTEDVLDCQAQERYEGAQLLGGGGDRVSDLSARSVLVPCN